MYAALALMALMESGDDRWMTPDNGWVEDTLPDGRRCWVPEDMWYVYDAHSDDAEIVMAYSERDAAREYARTRGLTEVEVYVVQPMVIEDEPGVRYTIHIPDQGVGTVIWPGE